MKLAICSTDVPFMDGSHRRQAESLELILREAGHQVERVSLPQVDDPATLFAQMAAFRWIDLSAADRIICIRSHAHLIPHPHKILWLDSHARMRADLWGAEYFPSPDDLSHRGFHAALRGADTAAMREARAIFAISRGMQQRLRRFNGIESELLYRPIYRPERFHCRGYNDEIVCVAHGVPHQRQHLLVEAMRYTQSDVQLRLCGQYSPGYRAQIDDLIARYGLQVKVRIDDRWILEAEKIEFLANCLAVASVPFDNDSHGDASLEACHSSKAVLTTTDSGGVIELIEDGVNGVVTDPTPQALAAAMDQLFLDRRRAERMGAAAFARPAALNVSWDHVLARLLA